MTRPSIGDQEELFVVFLRGSEVDVDVDPDGGIAATFVGGSMTPDERLDLVIERLLAGR